MAEKMDAFKEEAQAFTGENDMSCLEKLEPMSYTASPAEMAERVEKITGIEPEESVIAEAVEAVETPDAIKEQASAYTDVDMSCVEKLEPMSYTASPKEMAERIAHVTEELNK